ncbi:peptide-methionine (R)-S-oxide reductase MsrB [Flavobacterium ichthyis]
MMRKMLMMTWAICSFWSCQSQDKKAETPKNTSGKVVKTDQEWQKELTAEQYQILRRKGTERPFSGKYYDHFEKGKYICAACGNVLFNSDAKFDSDCGWPSFDQAISGSVIYKKDLTFGMERTEVICSKCDGHLGHVFDDGPKETTGKRFCTNSVSIEFIPENQ